MPTADVQSELESFFRELERFPLLTAGQERELGWLIINEGDQHARKLMINSNLRLVVSIAADYARGGTALGELVNEGTVGLIRAVDRFDPAKGTRFSTYAAIRIRSAVIKAGLSRHPRWVDPPRGMRREESPPVDAMIVGERYGRICRAIEDTNERDAWMLKLRFGMVASEDRWTSRRLAKAFGLSVQRVVQIEADAHNRVRGHLRNERIDFG